MSWTQASDPTNTNPWVGNCNNLDIFTPTPPVGPPGFPDVPGTYNNGMQLLEGFEFPLATYDGTNPKLWTLPFGGATSISISTDVRSSTLTGGHGLKIVADITNGASIRWNTKPLSTHYQYMRAYFKITSYTNTNGFRRQYNMFGWTDSTGDRSVMTLVMPGSGALPVSGVAHEVPGLATGQDGTVTLALNTWYRAELVTEALASGMWTTCSLYLGDTTTLVDRTQCHSAGSAMGGFPFVGNSSTGNSNAMTVIFDDVRLQTSDSVLNGAAAQGAPLWGPGGIWAIYPRETALGQFTPLSGTNSSNVDEFPLAMWDDDTSYVTGTGTVALLDSYSINTYPSGNYPTTGKFIKSIMGQNIQKNISGTNHLIFATYVDPLNTVWTGSDSSVSGSYAAGSYIFLIYPTPLPVEFSNSQEIGIYWIAGTNATHRVTSVWGQVEIVS